MRVGFDVLDVNPEFSSLLSNSNKDFAKMS